MNKQLNYPDTLPFDGRAITRAGKGRAPGTVFYFDARRTRSIELFVATVESTGQACSMAVVEDNSHMPRIRVNHEAVAGARPHVGDALLLADIDFNRKPLAARRAWRIASMKNDSNKKPPAPPDGRQRGTVIFVHQSQAWCKVSRDADGAEVFVHRTQWRPAFPMQSGQRVGFVAAQTEGGLAAFDVRTAA